MKQSEIDRTHNNERWILAALILIGHTVKHIYISALSVILLPNIKQSLNLSSTTYGSLSLAGRITGTITTFFSGFLGDKYARRSGTLLGISLLITGISYLLLSYSDTIFLLTILLTEYFQFSRKNTGKNASSADSPMPLIAAAVIRINKGLFVNIICSPL